MPPWKDVRALLPEDLDDENEGEEADNEEEKDKEEGEEPKPKAKTKWFDRDRALSKVNKQMQSALDKQREAAESHWGAAGRDQSPSCSQSQDRQHRSGHSDSAPDVYGRPLRTR